MQAQHLGSVAATSVPSYSPELIQIMRAALDEVMTKVPLELYWLVATSSQGCPDQQRGALTGRDGVLATLMNYAAQNELTPSNSLCALKRRGGARRPTQVAVRIKLPTARDEQDWRVCLK